jgi:hypothetical protein
MKQALLALALLGLPAAAQEGVSTLYALDPLARTLCFTDGGAGSSIQAGSVFNRCSHMAFESGPDRLVVGVQGAERGAFADLGTPEALARRYSYSETVGGGQGYASLALADGRITIRTGTRESPSQALREQQLLSIPASAGSVSITPGHVLLARLQRHREPELFVKFIVLAHVPGQSVTLRWAVLRPGA